MTRIWGLARTYLCSYFILASPFSWWDLLINPNLGSRGPFPRYNLVSLPGASHSELLSITTLSPLIGIPSFFLDSSNLARSPWHQILHIQLYYHLVSIMCSFSDTQAASFLLPSNSPVLLKIMGYVCQIQRDGQFGPRGYNSVVTTYLMLTSQSVQLPSGWSGGAWAPSPRLILPAWAAPSRVKSFLVPKSWLSFFSLWHDFSRLGSITNLSRMATMKQSLECCASKYK